VLELYKDSRSLKDSRTGWKVTNCENETRTNRQLLQGLDLLQIHE